MFAIIGSFEFLGNPVGLITDVVGDGMYDFFYEPFNGLMASPQDFGKGVAKGTRSLLKAVSLRACVCVCARICMCFSVSS